MGKRKLEYPEHWEELKAQVSERSRGFCEFCGLANGVEGYRDKAGNFRPLHPGRLKELHRKLATSLGYRVFPIVLTTAHLDHDESNPNVALERLAHLCQKCHFGHDRQDNLKRRKETQYKGSLFPYEYTPE